MAANTTKTKVMPDRGEPRYQNIRELFRLGWIGSTLKNVSSNKLLGITINHNLSWEDHINSIARKINNNLALLRDIKGCLPLEQCKSFQMPTYSHI